MACFFLFFFQAEDGIRDVAVTGVQTCALPISFAVPLAPSVCSIAAVSISSGGGEPAAAGAANGVLLSESAVRNTPASLAGSPCPRKCMYIVAGEERSR